ncbi:hypothetical protein A3G55_00465 [Candidatus Giovannonibacteria bacterium RIFCSPLOWO2_12_FULL_44_25]|uniref:Acylneuraminate cytidylyltransferase n=2 Tax=Candidatus Giovannoniibacteriota TaxID=1752738 RepID=A0A1F5WAI3_9BACT|nr:MAG: Acylneuraminate cytidylyltransferase [Parcubacteria group bacterium GW2011_GWC1_44_10]KKT60407.1 MAG: Acylneuraminate cytidylyltransferase [Candidatus Giovannonibacteria bacterium GW2011_GWA1_44_25]KKU30265.1 MAG: Acylneuraminate cytidylyltransferase [Candidatus Giovannonibacteria bacterium GW2011_GWB1_46_20]OGF50472.1 MAG: hypothetical protein A2120_02400 [Candidatus Giovannonibacteria bacterium GWA2_45_15]OGF59605.1 MAG: hypothetical protein A2W40_04295 [Candidatus Giovannonibacteria 
MPKKRKILAIIPARGGSKGIPNKAIKNFCGKPLIYYTIKEAKKSGLFDKIVVSTDSPKIAGVAEKFGALVPCLRPAKLARDKSNVADAVVHMLDYLRKSENYNPQAFFLLQPTSPLRDSTDILKSWKIFRRAKTKALTSVCRKKHQILNIVKSRIKTVSLGPLNRGDLPDAFEQDGMIYIVNTKFFLKNKIFEPEWKTAAYISPKWKAVDIDDMEDFKLAETLYKNRAFLKKYELG